MAVTIRDLAEKLNLSKSTVSYALNGGPKPVSEAVRLRVEEAAREMGFRRNEIARSLAVGRTYTIGFIPSSVRQRTLRSWFERTSLEAICVAADEMGLHLMLPAAGPATHATGVRDPQFASRVDGVVLLAPPADSELPGYLASRSIPMAIVAGRDSAPGPTFNADNAGGARGVVDHLYAEGHRRIGLVTKSDHEDVLQRHEAVLDRMVELGLDVSEDLIETTDLEPDGGYQAGLRMLLRPQRPTAVFCANDPTAVGFMQAAMELGIRVPKDLSVVGFDADEIGTTVFPKLTTVRQPVAKMAVAAFQAVVDQIAGERDVSNQLFPTQLIVRASTCPPEDNRRHA